MLVLQLWEEKRIGYCDLLKLDCEGCEMMLLSKLSEAGLFRLLGEWYADRNSVEVVSATREQLRYILATHNVLFAQRHMGREGHFTALPKS